MTKTSDRWVREAIHTRLWIGVINRGRLHRTNPRSPGWRPDLEVYRGEGYHSPGCPDPYFDDAYDYPPDYPPEQDIEEWLRDKGVIYVPEDPNDMSIYEAIIKGSAPTLRASLEAIEIDQDWVADIALQHVLRDGACFYPVYGENNEYRLDRLPIGWGTHKQPAHFTSLIDSLADGGFCTIHEDGTFSWNKVMAQHGKAVQPKMWGDGPSPWEQRKWELNYIWRKMPMALKQRYLTDQGPLNPFQLSLDLGAFFDVKARRWRNVPIDNSNIVFRDGLANEFDRLDREDGLPGRANTPTVD